VSRVAGGGPPTLLRRLLVAVLIPALAYMLYATAQQATESRRMARQVEELQHAVDGLAAENVRLQNELNFRRSDDFVERVAREQLGLVMPGDTAVNLVGRNVPAAPGYLDVLRPRTVPPEQAGRAPFDAWRAYFFGG
jgi:cell division protein FtsB